MNSKQSPGGKSTSPPLKVINTPVGDTGERNKPLPEFKKPFLKNWQLGVMSVLLLGAGFGLGQLFSSPPAEPAKVSREQTNILPVNTIKIEPVNSHAIERTYTGEVSPLRTSEVGFERGGKLVEVLVEEGDRVSRNDPLARLDTSNLEAQLQGLVARKQQAQAVLAELQNGARTEEVASAEAQVKDLQQQLELEKLKSSRREYLYDQGAIAREELDEIAFNQKALKERFNDAKSNLNRLNNGTRVEQIQAQEAAIAGLAAEIKDLEITIQKSVLLAPFNGIVSRRNLDEGTVVDAGTSILRLVENNRPKVKIGVPINVANNIQPESDRLVTIANTEYNAKVISVLPEVNAATRTRTVVLRLPASATTQVSPKQIARLSVSQTNNLEGYWLPINALTKGDRGLWTCYAVVSEGKNYKAERKYVELLETQGDRVLVKGTIQTGDRIITEGTHRLVPGQLIKLNRQ